MSELFDEFCNKATYVNDYEFTFAYLFYTRIMEDIS